MIKSNNPAASSGNPPAASNSPAARSPHRAIKPLSELGISPAPWFVDADGEIGCHYVSHAIRPNERRMRIVAKPNYNFDEHKADARLIAAAPKLYQALYKITKEQECGRDCAKCKNDGCVIQECRVALAEAAGEEVSDGREG